MYIIDYHGLHSSCLFSLTILTLWVLKKKKKIHIVITINVMTYSNRGLGRLANFSTFV